MKSIVVAALCMVGCSVAMVSAQARRSVMPGVEYPLDPLSQRTIAKDWQKCGEYFALPTGWHEPTAGKYAGIYFEVRLGPGPREFGAATMGQDKFITIIDESRKQPTITYSGPLNRFDPLQFHWTVRISSEGYKQSQPCLPLPKIRV